MLILKKEMDGIRAIGDYNKYKQRRARYDKIINIKNEYYRFNW